ncbi:MAG: hypothetical protein JRC87_01275 [Deltaproteobacteria bacterium]|nr:hypothetical protein [Deltaproteobacteria bacterium]
MQKKLAGLKPGAKRRTHLLLAAILWTAVGILLLTKGAYRITGVNDYGSEIVIIALISGTLKSYYVLDRSARKSISRILNFDDGTCLGAVYSSKTWLLVMGMMGAGVVLRNSSLPLGLLCFIYFTIGWGLLFSSRLAWRAWAAGKNN